MIVRTLEALFGFKVDTAQFNKASSAIDNFAENANTAMAALAGHFAITTIKDFVDHTTQAMADASRMAKMLGISTQSLEELRYAAEKSGVSIDTLDDSMKELQIRAVDAKSGSGEAADAFKALGMRSTDAAGKIREPIELLSDVADRLKKLPTQSERIWVADAMFGDQGAEMLKIIEGGSEGLARMRLEARELGYTLDESTSQSAIQFRQAITSLKAVLSAVVRTITKNILPAITSFIEGSASMWRSIARIFAMLSENTTFFRTILIELGVVLTALAVKSAIAFAPFLIAGASAIGMAALIIALVAGIALIIDDLWTAFEGGESVIKNLFESLLSWASNILSHIWDFLPANLQENLQAAFTLAKNFLASLSSLITTVFSRAWGFIRQEFPPVFAEIKSTIIKTFDEVVDDLAKAWADVARAFVDHIAQAVDNIKNIILGVKDVIGFLVPDFVKSGFSAAVDYVGGIGSQYDQPSQGHLAPQLAPSAHKIQNNNNQSVNVAVNVKSGAAPQEIGSEVQKAVRKELEKERFNAYIGVSQYAG
jgi:hypothetical protein